MKKAVAFIGFVMTMLIAVSCKKGTTTTPVSTTTPPTTTPATINSVAQVSYNVNGATTSTYISNETTYLQGSGSIESLSTTTLSTKNYSASLYNANTGQVYLEIDKGTLSFWGSMPDTTTFKNYFSLGSIAYSVNDANGIQITMSDTGATWSTSSGSQAGSTFSIVAVKEQWISGNQYMKFMANFSCKLYDQNGLNPKTITNGVFVGYFENQ